MSDSGFVGSKNPEARLFDACKHGRLVDVRELIGGNKVKASCVASAPHGHGDTPLHVAAFYGHKSIIEYLVEEAECDPESKNAYQNTPLHRAARQGQLEAVKYLMEEHNCNPMCKCHWKRTPLHSACKHGRIAVVKHLVNDPRVDCLAKDSLFQSMPLQLAAEWGTLEVVQYMMEHGVSTQVVEPGPYTLLHLAAFGGKWEIVEYLISKNYDPMVKDKDGKTPLHSACANGQLEVIKYLVGKCEVDVSCHNNPSNLAPLDVAAENGKIDVVKYLVEVKTCSFDHGSDQEYHYTALHHAAYGGKLEVVKYFIEDRKCDPECSGWKGRTPLHSACYNGRKNIVDYLMDVREVHSSIQDHMGATPLHLAAKGGHLSLIKRLLNKFRCNYFVTDNSGKTPLNYASDKKHSSVIEYLSHVHSITSGEQRKNLEEKLKQHILPCVVTGVKLGSGAYSDVIELTLKSDTSVPLAGKVFKHFLSHKATEHHQKLIKEIEIMVGLNDCNIVACKGVCFLPDSILPVLVMEQLASSLHDFLLQEDNSKLSLEKKLSFLLDTAGGLKYLHSQTPPIIHRDLTAKNVLLDSVLRAKIADFGNSRIMNLDPSSTSDIDTAFPGTLDYMPPEAQGSSETHSPNLDVFSFGHLSLFTVIQKQVRQLLAPSYTDSTGTYVRLEVNRRWQYLEAAQQLLPRNHFLMQLIKQCLDNVPSRRPCAEELVATLLKVVISSGEGLSTTKTVTSSNQRKRLVKTGNSHTQMINSGDKAFPVIRGVHIIAKKKIEIPPDEPLAFHWEGHGFKVDIPEGAIVSDGGEPVTMCIQVSLMEDYRLPDDGDLLSGVYWLSLHPHVKDFNEEVTISLQHCASASDNSSLTFITAKCSQESLPYTFTPLGGGSFSESGYGTIQVNRFSAFGIFGWGKKSYAFCTYYLPKVGVNVYEAHITVTQDLELHLDGVRAEYGKREKGSTAKAMLDGSEVLLDIQPKLGNPKGAWTKDGWELTPLVSTTLEKRNVDEYQPGRVIPHFAILLRHKSLDRQPCCLVQKINFIGVKSSTFVTITREPALRGGHGDEEVTPPSESAPRLAQLKVWRPSSNNRKIEIIKTVASRWQDIGDLLDFDATGQTLQNINANERTVELCCRDMFRHWLEGNGVQPISWATLLRILDDCDFGALAADIRHSL